MSLPDSLDCDGFEVQVIPVKGLGDHGKFIYGELSMHINPDDHEEIQFSTMIHEYAHMGYRLCCDEYNADDDEKFAAMFERVWRWLSRNELEVP